jgi:hypothetical protein
MSDSQNCQLGEPLAPRNIGLHNLKNNSKQAIRFTSIMIWNIRTETAYISELMFCWPCIVVYQYSKTNVMHFLFNSLRIKGLYEFRPLLAHPQEVLHNGTWYIVCVLCQLAAPGLDPLQAWCSQLT